MTSSPDCLYLPDVNVIVHAAEHLDRAWKGTSAGQRTPTSMLRAFDRSGDDALHDLLNANLTGCLVSAGLLRTTAVGVLMRKHRMAQGEAEALVRAVNFRSRDTGIDSWEQVRDQALGDTYRRIRSQAPEHLGDISSTGALLDRSDRRVDGEDLGVLTVILIAEDLYACPVSFGSADDEACSAAMKSRIAAVARYLHNRTTGRMHAQPGAARPPGPDKFAPKRAVVLPGWAASATRAHASH